MKRFNIVILLIIFSISLHAQYVNFEWAKSTGGSDLDESYGMTTDAIGNVYVTGRFANTVDFDPGSGTFNVTSNGANDAFVQKLDSNGNFQWVRQIGGSGWEFGKSIAVDLAGNIYTTGYFEDTVDFDPGPAVHELESKGFWDIFIQKLDASGNFEWAHSFGNTNADEGHEVVTDANGNVYITGQFSGTVDFDPGPAVFNMTSGKAYFILKLDNNGVFQWATSLNASSVRFDYGTDIAVDASGNVYLTGEFQGIVDFDPGPAVVNLTSNGLDDFFIQKLDVNGDFVWAKATGGVDDDESKSIFTDVTGNVYVTGAFHNTVDFDPGPSMLNLTSNGRFDVFVQKFQSDGTLLWAKSFGGKEIDKGTAVTVDGNGDIYVAGNYIDTVDFDPGSGIHILSLPPGPNGLFIEKLDGNGNFIWVKAVGDGLGFVDGKSLSLDAVNSLYVSGHYRGKPDFDPGNGVYNLSSKGFEDVFVMKLGQGTCSNLTLVYDSVSNQSCIGAGHAAVHATNGEGPYTYSWNTVPATLDSIISFTTSGLYTLTVTDQANCTTSSTLQIAGPVMGGFDLKANLLTNGFRTGFSSTIWLDAFNQGCVSTSGELMLVLDSRLSHDSSSITPDRISGDTLFWNFTNLTYDSAHLQPQVYVTTDTSAGIGDTICMHVLVTPLVGDMDTTNNRKLYCFPVINAYDPNDKQVYPQGECEQRYVVNDEVLTYKIRFQNTAMRLRSTYSYWIR